MGAEKWKDVVRITEAEPTALGEGLGMGLESQTSEGWCNEWIEVLFTE